MMSVKYVYVLLWSNLIFQMSPSSYNTDIPNTNKVRKNPSNVSSLSTDSGVIGQEGSHDSKESSPSNTLSHSLIGQEMSHDFKESSPSNSLSQNVIGGEKSHDMEESSSSTALSHSLSERNFTHWQPALPRRSQSVSCGDLSKNMVSSYIQTAVITSLCCN